MIILVRFLQLLFSFIFRLPAPAAIYMMNFAGEIAYRIARLTPIRKSVSRNVKKLFADADGDRLADRLLRNVSFSIFEVLCTPFFHEEHLKMIGNLKGRENIDLGLSNRNGILILLMHTGNYELTPALLSILGYKVNAILKAPDEPIFRIINRSRGHRGTKLINVLTDDMYRESLKALGDNEIVCLLIDTGALEGRHELFNFLGRKVPVATGWLTLAQRAQAAVIPAFSRREGNKVILNFGEPLTVRADNREEIKQKVGQYYENFIRSHPEQWAIFLNDHEVQRMLEGK